MADSVLAVTLRHVKPELPVTLAVIPELPFTPRRHSGVAQQSLESSVFSNATLESRHAFNDLD